MLLLGGDHFSFSHAIFLGCEKAKTLSQNGCEKAKTLSQKGCEKAKTLSQKGCEKEKTVYVHHGSFIC